MGAGGSDQGAGERDLLRERGSEGEGQGAYERETGGGGGGGQGKRERQMELPGMCVRIDELRPELNAVELLT